MLSMGTRWPLVTDELKTGFELKRLESKQLKEKQNCSLSKEQPKRKENKDSIKIMNDFVKN